MAAVRLLVSNSSASHVETEGADWIVMGLRPDEIAGTIDNTTSFGSVVDETRSLPGEYSVVSIDTNRRTTVRAYRGLTSSYDVFYCRRPRDGTIVIGDHFRDVLSQLSHTSRSVPESVAVDQLLFGARPTDTYVEEVDRLGHGERLEWDVGSDPETKVVGSLSVEETIGVDGAKRRLDRYLRDVFEDRRFDDSVATMLSGGVDSTLLHTYVENDSTVSAAFDSPEFEFEVNYAEEATDLLGSTHEQLTFDEGEYREHLETTIEATGQPLLLPQDTLMHQTFSESPHDTYVNGGLADGLFGTGTAALAYLARFLGPVHRLIPKINWETAAVKETAERLTRPATAANGSAMNFRIHSDQDRVASIFGRETVNERKRGRLRYTRKRIDVANGTGYEPHMHLGHCIEYFHDVILTTWRHAAHANGKTMLAPFAGRDVLETALAIPPKDRYARFVLPTREQPTRVVEYKYLLKDLLEERLPEYETRKPKGHGMLPKQRYLDSGPLSDSFKEYPVPEFIPEEHREFVVNGTEEISWYALNYAIWRDRVLENDDLDVFGTTTVIERGARPTKPIDTSKQSV